ERELAALLERRLADLRGRNGTDVDVRSVDGELVFRTRTGLPENPRNVAQRGVQKAALDATLRDVPRVLRQAGSRPEDQFAVHAANVHVRAVPAAKVGQPSFQQRGQFAF